MRGKSRNRLVLTMALLFTAGVAQAAESPAIAGIPVDFILLVLPGKTADNFRRQSDLERETGHSAGAIPGRLQRHPDSR